MGKVGAIFHIALGIGIFLGLTYFTIFPNTMIRFLAAVLGFFVITAVLHKK